MRISRRQACVSTLYAYSSLLLASALPGLGCGVVKKVVEPDLLTSLAFGSCNKQEMLTKHWPIIKNKNAQGWLWMGDAIYADGLYPNFREKEYQKVLADEGYQALISSSFVMGTWDDHDYAANDSGREYAEKVDTQKVFLDFIGEDKDSPRRLQKGIYTSKLMGKEANQIQFILLDMRYFKEASGPSADPLGKDQWGWLENEIKRSGPAMKVVVSSIQVLTDFTGKDTWACYPEAQTRFLNLLSTSPVPVTLLSGDRHLTETSRREVASGRIIHEVTSSGITHTTDMKNGNPFRVQVQINETNFGVLNFGWDSSAKPILQSLKSSVFSPQTGTLLRDFDIPLSWT
ncbi:MAG: alkaline phosphatase family protein [Oligoflexus sp.]|nr:alkaline phosphatase family protein [Oligoflexus sp.]